MSEVHLNILRGYPPKPFAVYNCEKEYFLSKVCLQEHLPWQCKQFEISQNFFVRKSFKSCLDLATGVCRVNNHTVQSGRKYCTYRSEMMCEPLLFYCSVQHSHSLNYFRESIAKCLHVQLPFARLGLVICIGFHGIRK